MGEAFLEAVGFGADGVRKLPGPHGAGERLSSEVVPRWLGEAGAGGHRKGSQPGRAHRGVAASVGLFSSPLGCGKSYVAQPV